MFAARRQNRGRDCVDYKSVATTTWSMYINTAMATIHIDASGGVSSALLTMGGVDMHATIVEPKGVGVVFTVETMDLQPSPGVNQLIMEIKGSAGNAPAAGVSALDI